MGSQTILDLIASTMVFGSLLLMALRMNIGNTENLQMYQMDVVVQENLVEVTNLIEDDFRRIGYCKDPSKIPDPSRALLYADSIRIKYLTDLPTDVEGTTGWLGDGNLDSVDYYVGPTSEAANTPNPLDRLLYRVENTQPPRGVNLGVTTFDLQYYDALKNKLSSPVANPREIQYMQITIEVQSYAKVGGQVNTAAFDTLYQSAYWRQVRIVAKNLRNR